MEADQFVVADQVQLIDVRNPEEFAAGHLEGARNLPLARLGDRLSELDVSRPVLTVCRTGVRSKKAADLLVQNGFDADTVNGGVVALSSAGIPLFDAAGEVVPTEEEEEEYLVPELAHARDSILEVIFAMQERFGDRERTEAEELAFMREFLAGKGKSPEEIDAFMSVDD